jgi:hypothetical protein
MYAEMSQRPPPPRPFLNLLRSTVHPSLRRLVRALLRLSTVVVGALTPATGTCQAARGSQLASGSYGTDRPPVTKRYKIATVPSDSQDAAGGLVPGLTGAPDVAAPLRRLVATAPVRNGITAGVVDAEPRSAVPRLGYPPQNPWRTGEVLAVSGDRQSRSPLRAATHDYRGRASGVGPATNRSGRRLRRLVRRVRAKCAACGPRLARCWSLSLR